MADQRLVAAWDPRPVKWRGVLAVRVREIPWGEGRWVKNDRGILDRFLRLTKPSATAQDLAQFIHSDGLIEQTDRLGWALSRGPVVPRTIVTLTQYQRIGRYLQGILVLGRALHEFADAGAKIERNWGFFARAQGVPEALEALDLVSIWTEARREAERMRAWRLKGRRWRRDKAWLAEAIALRSAADHCFNAANMRVRLAFDWLAPEPRGIDYAAHDTWSSICLALAHELVDPTRICRACQLPYRVQRKRGRPRLLCPDCFTPAEGRRVSGLIFYRKQRRSNSD